MRSDRPGPRDRLRHGADRLVYRRSAAGARHREKFPILRSRVPTWSAVAAADIAVACPPYPRPVGLVERDAELAALRQQWARARAGSGALGARHGGVRRRQDRPGQRVRAGRSMGQAPVLWGACDPLATPRPLGPLLDVRDRLGAETRSPARGRRPGARDPPGRPTTTSAPTRASSSWTTCTGPTRAPSTCCGSCCAASATTSRWSSAPLRPDEIDAVAPPAHPARRRGPVRGTRSRSTCRPLSSDAVRTLVDDRPIDADRLHVTHRRQPVLRRARCSTTTATTCPARCATPSWPGRWTSRTPRATCSTCWCARRRRSPTGCSRSWASASRPLRSLYQAGLIRRSQRGVAFRHDLCRLAIAGSLPPGGEAALHRRMLDALEAGASEEPAVLVHHARGAGDPERVLRYATAGRHRRRAHRSAHAGGRVLRAGSRAREAGPPEVRADLLERLATEQYVLDRLDEAISSGTAGHAPASAGRRRGRRQRRPPGAGELRVVPRQPGAADRHAADAVAVLAGGGRAERCSVTPSRCRPTSPCRPTTSPTARDLLEQARGLADRATTGCWTSAPGCSTASSRSSRAATGGRESVLEIVEPAVNRIDEIHSSGFSNLAYLDVEQRRLPEAAAVLDVSLPLTVEFDLPVCHVWQLGARGRLGLLQGDWQAAEDDAVGGARPAERAARADLGASGPRSGRSASHRRRRLRPGRRVGPGDTGWGNRCG